MAYPYRTGHGYSGYSPAPAYGRYPPPCTCRSCAPPAPTYTYPSCAPPARAHRGNPSYGGNPPARAYGGNPRARRNPPARAYGGNPSALAYGRYQNRPVNPGIVAAGFEGLAIGAVGAAAIMSGGGGYLPAPPYSGYQNVPIFTGLVATEVELLAAGFFN